MDYRGETMRTPHFTAALLAPLFAVVFAVLVGFATPASAKAPSDVVQGSVDEILGVLRDSGGSLSPAGKQKIFDIVDNTFDMRLFGRRTLGRRWNVLNPQQQNEFVDLYAQLLKNTYIERVEAYSDEKVRMDGEVDLGRDKYEVRTTVIGNGVNVPIFYRLYNSKQGWRVYDVLVEGVSLVNNYRSQFTQILSKGTPEDLLNQLRQKVS